MKRFLPHILACLLLLWSPLLTAQQQAQVPPSLVDAVQRFSVGDYKEAASILKTLHRKAPDDDAVCYYLSLCHLAEYKLASSRELMERAAKLDSTNRAYRYRLAQIYMMSKQPDKAVREYEAVLRAHPKDRRMTDELSDAYLEAGRYPEYYAIARDFMHDDQIEEAAKAKYLGGVCKQLDRSGAKAMRPYLDSLYLDFDAAHPASAVPMQEWCQVLGWLGDLEGLDACLDKISVRFPADSTLNSLGLSVKFIRKDYKGAEKYLRREMERHKGDRQKLLGDYSLLGEIYQRAGQRNKCSEIYEKALRMDPDCIPVLNNYAYFLAEENRNLKKALQMSAKTVAAEPDNPTFLDTYGWILYRLGRLEEARAQFNHAKLYGGNDNAVILDHFATVLYDLGEYRLAFSYWEKAVARNTEGEVEGLEEKIAAKKAALQNGKK